MKVLLSILSLVFLSQNVSAGETRQVVASFDITPCSRATSYVDSFGIRWPTVEFARQSTDLVVQVGHNQEFNYNEFNQANSECNGLALAAAGITFVVNPSFFASAYEGTYSACMYGRLAGQITGIGVHVESKCHW